MTTIAFSDFVRRQTKDSPYSYTELDDATVIARTLANFGAAEPGYRDGVCLVSIEARGFFSATVTLKEGDLFVGSYKARRPGETPRRQVGVVGGQKMPAKAVQIVLYRADVLAEDGDQTPMPTECPMCSGRETVAVIGASFESSGRNRCPECNGKGTVSAHFADWEIVSINATPTGESEPMTVGTLLANHFHVEGSNDGGTSTGMTDAELVAALRVSHEYWKDKAKVAPAE